MVMSITALLLLVVGFLVGGAVLIGVVYLLFKGSDSLIDRFQNKRDQNKDRS